MRWWLGLQVAAWHRGWGGDAQHPGDPSFEVGFFFWDPRCHPSCPAQRGKPKPAGGFLVTPGVGTRSPQGRWQRRGRVPSAFPVRGRAGSGGGNAAVPPPPQAHTCLRLLCHFQQGPGASRGRRHRPTPLGLTGTVPRGAETPRGGGQRGGSVCPAAPAAHPQCCSHVSILLEELPAGSREAR